VNDFDGALRAMMLHHERRYLATIRCPLFPTPAQRAEAKAWADALTVEELDAIAERLNEYDRTHCPECHRAYDE
jgi:hypothetical protein